MIKILKYTYWRGSQLRTYGMAILTILGLCLFSACEKSEHPGNPAAVQVMNALDDGEMLYVNPSDKTPAKFNILLLLHNKYFYLRDNLLRFRDLPQTLSFYGINDTLPKDAPVISMSIDAVPGAIYSMFIFGNKANAQFIMHNDQIPPINRSDSTGHFRIINLSADQAISVNLKGEPHKSLMQQVDFKAVSPFIALSANKNVASFEFEFRDFATGELLASYVGSNLYVGEQEHLFYSKANSLVFTGKKGATDTNQQKVVLMNHR